MATLTRGSAPACLASAGEDAIFLIALAGVLVALGLLAKRRFETLVLGDWLAGAFKFAFLPYLRLFHRAKWVGFEQLPHGWDEPGRGLIVAGNHPSGIDPVLLQCRMRRKIRWFMEAAEMLPILGWAWRRLEVIPVRFDRTDGLGIRHALRHLRDGGVVGLFPEAGIARPPRHHYAFLPGIGALAARGRAPVLLVWIHGTPEVPTAWAALWTPSRAVVEVVGWFDPPAEDDEAFRDRLRGALAARSGWPLSDEPLEHLRERLRLQP